MPRVMTEALMMRTKQRLNMLPAKHGVSSCCIPGAMMGEPQSECSKDCKGSFGEHAQACQHNEPTNMITKHSVNSICLCANDDAQGGHVVMNLNAGKTSTRGHIAQESCDRAMPTSKGSPQITT